MKISGPTKQPSVPFVPENPSACKIIQAAFMDEESADVVFIVQDVSPEHDAKKAKTESQRFYAHRFVLERTSKTLAELCRSESNESTPLHITDVSPGTFKHMLHHIYGGKIPEDELKENAMLIMDAADKYGVTCLKLEAEASLVGSITITMENMMEYLLYADAKNCALLKEHVIDFIIEN